MKDNSYDVRLDFEFICIEIVELVVGRKTFTFHDTIRYNLE